MNHTVGGLWADPLSGDDYAPPLPTVEDHCGIGLLSDGTRVIVNHHNPGDQVYVTLEDTLGSPTAGTPLELLSGGGVAYNHPVVTVADVGGADEVHVVATSLTGAHGVVHRSCARSGAVTCGDPADWSATDTVVPAGTLTERPWPQVAVDAQGTVYVAWVEERVGATDTIEVAYRCAGGSFVDAGVVTTAPGEQAFASDGVGNVNNRMLSGPRIAVDDVAGEVGLVYLLVDGGSSTPMFAHQPLATCP